MPITMPKAALSPSKNLTDYTLLIAGTKKIGKTSFCAQFPNHIILEFETGNAKHLNCRYVDVPTHKDAQEVLQFLEKNPNYCSTIIVDNVQALYELFVEKITNDLKVNDPSEKAHGAAWGTIGRRFSEYLNRLQGMGKGVIYTAHTKTKYYTNINGVEVSKLETNLGSRAHEMMYRNTQFWGVMAYGKGKNAEREMVIAGDEITSAGHGFKDHFKLCNRVIPMGKSPEEAYSNFIKAWNNEPIGQQVTKVKVKK